MNGTVRRLMVGGIGTVALCWAMRPGVAWAAPHVNSEKECTSGCASPASHPEVTVAEGSQRVFHANGEITKSSVANPEIADFVQTSPKEVAIVGLKQGQTTVTIWSEVTSKPVTLLIKVLKELPESSKSVQVAAHDEKADSEVTQAGLPPAIPAASAGPGLPISAETNYVQQVPAISIETSSPVMANVGRVVEQQILVKNVGSVPAEQVEVRGTVSIDSELMSTEPKADINNSMMVWRFSKIPAGGQQKIIVRVKPLIAGELSCHTNVSFKSSASVKVQVREPKLKLTCEGPKAVVVGSEVHVTLTVANIGNGTAEGVRIRQVVPAIAQTRGRDAAARSAPLSMEVGNLEPGESRMLETVSRATEPGLIQLHLVAESQDGALASVEHMLTIQAPKLALTSTGADFRYLGRRATYQMVLTNPGDAMATNVNMIIGLPEGLEYIDGGSDAIYNSEKRTVAYSIGILEAGQRREFTVTVNPKMEGQHLQRAVAWADGNLLVKADKVTRVEGTTSILMEVTDVDDPIEVGSETTYQIHLVNRGSKAAERLQVVASVPEGMAITAAQGYGHYRVQGQQVIFEPIPSLAPQSTAVLQVKVKGVKAGNYPFRAVLSCPSMSNSIITEEATTVYGD